MTHTDLSLQSLPPTQAHLCLRVEQFIRQGLGSESPVDLAGTTLLVALSGGADSTALLHILHILRHRLGINLVAAHLDHALRAESAAECAHARALCDTLAIPFVSQRCDVRALAATQRCGLEEAGRNARYSFLASARVAAHAQWIATAHHRDDLTEDVLLRLVRGTGWPALGGMRALDQQRCLLRPLLLTPRAELVHFLASIGATWVEDASNQSDDFLRNRIRNQVVPLLLRENPSLTDNMADLWQLARIDEAYWDSLLPSILPNMQQEILPDTVPGMQPDMPCNMVPNRSAATPQPASRSSAGPIQQCAPTTPCTTPEQYAGGEAQSRTITLQAETLRALPTAARLRLYRQAVCALGPGQPRAQTLLALDRIWQARRGGRMVQLPGGKTAMVRRGAIIFTALGGT